MATPFGDKNISREIALKAGNVDVPVILEVGASGVKFKRKGKRKVIEASWSQILSAADTFTPQKDGPTLTQKEQSKIKENPLAFLLDG